MRRFSAFTLPVIALMLTASLALSQTAPAAGSTTPTKTTTTRARAATTTAKGAVAATTKGTAATTARGATASPAAGAAATLVDLNTATRAELMKLPGIGEAISDKILKARPFANKAQLLSRGLVSKVVYDKLSPLVVARQK
jgi:competence protein ComEA